MSKRNKNVQEEASEGAPEWMTTYSDLVTLLLTFFILLFSMAVIDKQKFEEVAFSLRSSFTHSSDGEMFNENTGKSMISMTPYNNESELKEAEIKNDKESEEEYEAEAAKEEALEKVKINIEKLIDELELTDNITVIEEKESIILRVDSIVLFDFGSADIKPSGEPVLKKIGVILNNLQTDIFIQGHTDDRPIDTLLFPSNWELSTKRATNVVQFFVKNNQISQQYLTTTGNAEFKPIVPNDTELNRQKNRRIDIVISK